MPHTDPPHPLPETALLNPATGDRLWLERRPQTAVAHDHATPDALVFRCELPPASRGTPLHFHPGTDEQFECLSGALAMLVEPPGTPRREIRLAPGERLHVPRGTLHRFWNPAEQPVQFRSTVTPGRDFERFLRAVYGLGAAGRLTQAGMPRNPLDIAILREWSDLYFPGVPRLIQRPAFATLSAVATVFGRKAKLERYSQQPAPSVAVPNSERGRNAP